MFSNSSLHFQVLTYSIISYDTNLNYIFFLLLF